MHNQVIGYKHLLGSNLCLAKQIQPTCLTTARLPICPKVGTLWSAKSFSFATMRLFSENIIKKPSYSEFRM